MNIINVLISCVGDQERPGYCYLLERYRDINVLAESGELFGSSIWAGLSRCDVLLIDEGIIDQYGFQAVRSLVSGHPRVRVLLVLEKESQYRTLTAVSQGIQGVITQAACSNMLRKAVRALFGGEAWLSRKYLPLIHNQLNCRYINDSPLGRRAGAIDGWVKMN